MATNRTLSEVRRAELLIRMDRLYNLALQTQDGSQLSRLSQMKDTYTTEYGGLGNVDTGLGRRLQREADKIGLDLSSGQVNQYKGAFSYSPLGWLIGKQTPVPAAELEAMKGRPTQPAFLGGETAIPYSAPQSTAGSTAIPPPTITATSASPTPRQSYDGMGDNVLNLIPSLEPINPTPNPTDTGDGGDGGQVDSNQFHDGLNTLLSTYIDLGDMVTGDPVQLKGSSIGQVLSERAGSLSRMSNTTGYAMTKIGILLNNPEFAKAGAMAYKDALNYSNLHKKINDAFYILNTQSPDSAQAKIAAATIQDATGPQGMAELRSYYTSSMAGIYQYFIQQGYMDWQAKQMARGVGEGAAMHVDAAQAKASPYDTRTTLAAYDEAIENETDPKRKEALTKARAQHIDRNLLNVQGQPAPQGVTNQGDDLGRLTYVPPSIPLSVRYKDFNTIGETP